MKKMVIFDLDGTLLNSLADLTNAVNQALSERNLPKRQMEDIRRFVGNGAKKLVECASDGLLSLEDEAALLAAFLKIYEKEQKKHTKPYDGIMALLKTLNEKGITCVICSNKPAEATEALSDYYFGQYIAKAYGAREGIPRKPAPDMINLILKEHGMQVSDALYVGDSEVDILTAQEAKIDMLTCTWGFRSEETLIAAGALQLVHSPAEILSYLFGGDGYE